MFFGDSRLFCRPGGGDGVGAGNVPAGSAVMGAGIKRKFGLIPKKSDAFNSRLPEWSRSRVPAAFPAPQPPLPPGLGWIWVRND